jgi:hypothetical protein
MGADQDDAGLLGGVRCAAQGQAADRVRESHDLVARKALAQPGNRGGAVVLGPVLDGRLEPAQRRRPRQPDAAVVVGQDGDSPLGEKGRETPVAQRRNPRAAVQHRDAARRARPERGVKHGADLVPVGGAQLELPAFARIRISPALEVCATHDE